MLALPVHIQRKLHSHNSKKSKILVISLKKICPVFLLMDNIEKEINLWKENCGSPSINESKLQAKLAHLVPSSMLAYSSSVACVFYV